MGVFDFIKSKPTSKVQLRTVQPSTAASIGSRGTVTVDRFTFNVRDYSLKGFILEPYDEKILAKGQKFKCNVNLSKDGHSLEGRAEAMVTKITSGALAATFTIRPSVN
ncbi:MAG: hypothetical protein CMM58_03250 [Rhodospirillaceae bacterium]|nr:hypothetical protein [Rhodospirillaceae bacterium]|tara:strand:+ start:745 stop:1068 length:324 start_codon:yes stop_codon:yes gene_type:complete